MRFAPGRIILHRNVRRGRLGWVRPGRVISDDDRGLLLWIDRGSPVASEVTAEGHGMRTMPFTEYVTRTYRPAVQRWQGAGVLKFLPANGETFAAHSVWWFRDQAGAFTGWYVNLEEPGVRWLDAGGAGGGLAGVDIVDQDLDIWATPDRRWIWKDEDEFAERLALPEHYWVPDPASVWAEGERVVKSIEAGQFPFDGTWCDFRPDPTWVVPADLPPGWDRPPARP